ncbi:ubiquitin-like small modifier protein 1 [Methanohalophilus halophilus]
MGKAMAAKKVRLFANVREKAGTSEIEVNGDTVSEILDEIIAKYPNLEELIFEDGKKLRGYINILINGENIQHIEGTDSTITEKDEVAIFPPVSGG